MSGQESPQNIKQEKSHPDYHSIYMKFKPFNCEDATIDSYRCKDCHFQADLATFLKEHVKKHQSENKEDLKVEFKVQSYICRRCSFETHFSMKWLQHSISCHNNSKIEELSTEQDKSDHVYNNFDTVFKWHSYSLRPFETKGSHDLKRHIQMRYSEVVKWRYKCDYCTFQTNRPHLLKRHTYNKHLSEHKVEWHRCEKCPYKCRQKATLNKHIQLLHLEEKDVKWLNCEHCSFRSKYRQTIKLHTIYKHVNDEDKTLFNDCHLDEDLNDDDNRWYCCNKCLYKTKHKDSLELHVNALHPVKRWHKCGQCSYKARNVYVLKGHVTKVHSRKAKYRGFTVTSVRIEPS